jgi:hypothetical protein
MNNSNAFTSYFEGKEVNIINDKGEAWFRASDIHALFLMHSIFQGKNSINFSVFSKPLKPLQKEKIQ